MIKKILLFIICSQFLNCNQKPNIENSVDNDIVQPIAKSSVVDLPITPIFLSLSPRMSDEEFSDTIKKLNIEGKLNFNQFIVNSNNINYLFKIEKTNNSIRLKYSDEETKSIQNLSYEISDSYLNKYTYRKNVLLSIFDSKYNLSKVQLPQNINLKNFGLLKEHYKLYDNNNKSILVGYTILGYKAPSPEEKEIEEKNKPESSLPDFKGLINYQEPINYVIFGCEYEINYYYKDDIEKLLKIMLKESTEATKTKNEDLKKETQRINNINRNKKEL